TEYDMIRDDKNTIKKTISKLVESEIEVIISNGGTGISKRDVTYDAVTPLIDKHLPGFGEIFRYESYREIGIPAALSRSFAGVSGKSLIICLPGSRNAVRLGANMIASELGHFVWEVRK
ncbi:MAG: MogA/MoaB family molybdenum cofactor biosynthesis protein, partial [Candidatus Altiarchaeota archaeon]